MSGPEECQLLTFANNSVRMSACVRAIASDKSITKPEPSPRLRLLCKRTQRPMDRSHIDHLGPSRCRSQVEGPCMYLTHQIKCHSNKPMAQGYPQDGQPHQSFAPPNGLSPQASSVPSAGSPAGSSGTPGICAVWSAQLLCGRLASYAACAAGCFLPRRPSKVAPSRLSSKAPFCLLRSLTCCLAAAVTAAECCP